MAKRFLVTGGLGFLGAALARKLVESGNSVRVFDNGFRGSANRLGNRQDDIEIVTGDIRDPSAVNKAVTGVNTVCHFAYVNGTQFFYDRPAYVLDVGVKGMCNVLDSCIRNNVQDLILASSSEVYQTPPVIPTDESVPLSVPDPSNPRYSYGGGKIISELMALNYGRQYFQRVVIVRPHNVFGPDMGWEHVIPQFVQRMAGLIQPGMTRIAFPIQGSGTQSRAFIFVDDFIKGVTLVIEQGIHLNIYNVGTSEERRVGEIARSIGRFFGVDVQLETTPDAEGGTSRRCPSITKLQNLGFSPKWIFEDALKVTVQWYREHLDQYRARPVETATLFLTNIQ
jgi:nucleoside-diphosphate-sugar epimerase